MISNNQKPASKKKIVSKNKLQRNIVERCHQYNAGRTPSLVERKFEKMSENPFSFFRGSCHLFYEDFSLETSQNAPIVWICGDLHTENFGTYKGANRLVYFDINDFDESILAPATLEITRLLTSIFVAADTYQLSIEEARDLAHICVDAYSSALQYGKAGSLERETARGVVKKLLHSVQHRTRREFLDARTKKNKNSRIIIDDNKRYFEIEEAQTQAITKCVEDFGVKRGEEGFFRVLDVKRRVAGTGSLGVERFAVLIEGNGSPHKNYLLDIKEALPSALASCVEQKFAIQQPSWQNEAWRVIEVQHRMQFQTPHLLSTVQISDKNYILRELQPTQDKLDLTELRGKYKRFATAIATMGELTAFAQIRSAGRQGSAIADELIDFAFQAAWKNEVLAYAESYSKQVHNDFYEFIAKKTLSTADKQ